MANPDYFAESPSEYNSSAQLARQVGIASGVPGLRGKYDPEERLNLAFYNRAVKNERKSRLGYHHVFAGAGFMGADGRQMLGEQLFEDDAKTIPLVADCDCEEENILRAGKGASTLARVIRERVAQGVHITPGRPIYEDQIYVKIMVPGEQRNEVDTQAIILGDPDIPDTCEALPEAAHNHKYPKHWADYKARQNKRIDGAALFGTPLRVLAQEGCFILKASQVAAFEASGIRTVEQLMSAPDNVAQHFMGFSNIRNDVKAWRDAQAAQAPTILANEVIKRLEQDNKTMRDELQEMRGLVRNLQPAATAMATAQIQAQSEAVRAGLLASEPIGTHRGPGRPRKVEQE